MAVKEILDEEEDLKTHCGECFEKMTPQNRWSDYTCKKCARLLGLDSFER